MDLANASVKYETLQAQLDGRTVRAPFAGIVVAAPGLAGEQGSREPVQAGSKLGQGQALFGLASVERLKVSAKVSELDINQLREGQAVEISGDGFEGTTLAGVIAPSVVRLCPAWPRRQPAVRGDGVGSAARSPPVAEDSSGNERQADGHHLSQRTGHRRAAGGNTPRG